MKALLFVLGLCMAFGAKPLSDQSVFQLESSWLDQGGRKITLSAFRGKPSVVAMVYTRCQFACPLITTDIQKIENSLPPELRDQTQFVLVSFDPKGDTTAALKAFAGSHGLDSKRWTLLTGSAEAVRDLASVLGVTYKKNERGEFSHSNVITILDSEGLIHHQQQGLRQDPKASVAAVISGFQHRL